MKNKRIFEIDLLRTIAIILMVSYHIAYDLKEFAGINISYDNKTWLIIGKTSLLLFIFLSGISSNLSNNIQKNGVKIFICGILITIVTYIFSPKEYIRFGVLHFFGVCMIIYPFINKLRSYLIFIISLISLILGFYFERLSAKTFIFIPFGIMYNGFSTLDYVPLFPYISFYLLGILFGRKFYSKKKGFLNYDLNFIKSISKNSLLIYMLHQPAIYFTIILLKILFKNN